MIRLEKVAPGEQISAAAWNAMVDAITERTPLTFPGGALFPTPAGFHVRARRKSGGGAAAETSPHPFRLVDASEVVEDELIHKIRVVYGTLAGEAPAGMSEGDDPPYILTLEDAAGIIWGGLTRDEETGEITSRFIDLGADLPEDSETVGYIELGSWSITDDVLSIAQAVSGSQAHQYCGGHLWGLV